MTLARDRSGADGKVSDRGRTDAPPGPAIPLPAVLTAADVMRRYGLRDRRAARKVMDAAGAFHVAGRLVVRMDDLDAHELALREARKAPKAAPTKDGTPHRRGAGSHGRERAGTPRAATTQQPLAPGWWRETKEPG